MFTFQFHPKIKKKLKSVEVFFESFHHFKIQFKILGNFGAFSYLKDFMKMKKGFTHIKTFN